MFVHILSMFPEHSSESSQAVNRSVTWLRDGDKWLGWAVNTAQKEPWLLRGGDIQAEPQKGGEKGSLQKESWGGGKGGAGAEDPGRDCPWWDGGTGEAGRGGTERVWGRGDAGDESRELRAEHTQDCGLPSE